MFASTYSAYFEAELFGNCNRFFRQSGIVMSGARKIESAHPFLR